MQHPYWVAERSSSVSAHNDSPARADDPVNEWLALLRGHEGGVTTLEGRFLNHGQSVADYLPAALDDRRSM